MAEKRRRSCQDTQDAPAGDNGSEGTFLAAVTQCGSGPGGRGLPRFLLHHTIFDHGLSDGLGPDEPRLLGNLLYRKDWIQLRKIALSDWVLSPGPRSYCPLLVHRVRTPPLRNLPRGAPGQVGSRCGWSPWYRCASKIDGPCPGRPDSSSDSETEHLE